MFFFKQSNYKCKFPKYEEEIRALLRMLQEMEEAVDYLQVGNYKALIRIGENFLKKNDKLDIETITNKRELGTDCQVSRGRPKIKYYDYGQFVGKNFISNFQFVDKIADTRVEF